MRWPQPLLPARFVRRVNRFRVEVEQEGRRLAAHLPNSGRLLDLLHPGTPVWLHPQPDPRRRTPFDLLLVAQGATLVSVDARLPPRLLHEAIRRGLCDDWLGAPGPAWTVRPEPAHGVGRFDLYLEGPAAPWWVETKSVTWVEGGVAYFPDAPTDRGRRHLHDLAQLARAGQRCAVVFIVQRPDAQVFAPHPADPDFPAALQQAVAAGVRVLAYACQVDLEHITPVRPLPVRLGGA